MAESKVQKNDEYSILRRVFNVSDYPDGSIEEVFAHGVSKPDFMVTRGDDRFCVEVTTYFQNVTSDVYSNDAKYRRKLFDGGEIKPKSKLERVEVGVVDKGQYAGIGNFIYQETLPIGLREKKLFETIARKARKIPEYEANGCPPPIELIVYDQAGDLFSNASGREYFNYLKQISLSPIEGLPFRKIYLVKKFGFLDEQMITLTQAHCNRSKDSSSA